MTIDLETLQTELPGALRECEPGLPAPRNRAPDAVTLRQADLKKVGGLLQHWKQALNEPVQHNLPETLYYIPKLRARGTPSLIKQLTPIVNALDVTLHRADVRIRQSGEGKEPNDWQRRRNALRRYRDYGNGNPLEDVTEAEKAKFTFKFVEEEEVTIQTITTLDGEELVEFAGRLIDEEAIIPRDFAAYLGKPDEKNDEADEGIWGDISMEHWFNRSILVFAPRGIVNTTQAPQA